MFATSTARMAARFLKTSSFSATTFFSAATLAISCLPCSSVSREKNRSTALGTTQRFQRKRYRATLLYKSAQACTKTLQHFPLLTHACLQFCFGWTEIPSQWVGCGPDRSWKLRLRCRHLAPSTSRHHDASVDARLDVEVDVVNDVHDWRHLRDRGCANHRPSVTSTKAPFPCVPAPRRPRPGTLVNGRVSARPPLSPALLPRTPLEQPSDDGCFVETTFSAHCRDVHSDTRCLLSIRACRLLLPLAFRVFSLRRGSAWSDGPVSIS